ncbi:hypothetical protein BvCmsKKP061_05273 [Escherichia coli]|uniref:Uncharacterized protein n=1 Tax=Escherichia coli TaxID=562 RepID=A0A4C9I5H3_ECOLX|nr:hypothetical protein BvCmsKKP061_05273 [Escherichia coli]
MTGQIQPPHQGKQRKRAPPGQKHPRLIQMQNAVCMVQHHQYQSHSFDDIPLSGGPDKKALQPLPGFHGHNTDRVIHILHIITPYEALKPYMCQHSSPDNQYHHCGKAEKRHIHHTNPSGNRIHPD